MILRAFDKLIEFFLFSNLKNILHLIYNLNFKTLLSNQLQSFALSTL